MQKFPTLKTGQVALMRSDTRKGYILDDTFIVATEDKQIVYTVINSHEEAIDVANQIIEDHPSVECVIYDNAQKVLSFLRPSHLL